MKPDNEPLFLSELIFEVTRSRGPGGQNVNRTNTAVIVRWNAARTEAFSDEKKMRLLIVLGPQLSRDGDLVIRSDEFRLQEANRKRCLEKLEQLIERALFVPKKRRKTKPTKGSIERRRTSKKRRSDVKQSRRRVDY